MTKDLLILFILVGMVQVTQGQVEHNFLVGPNKTDCDSLPEIFPDQDRALELIQGAKFRFTQEFEIRRNAGFRGANFYSCDNEEGLLVVKVDDQSIIFPNVPKRIWDEFIGSNNMEGYYLRIKREYPILQTREEP